MAETNYVPNPAGIFSFIDFADTEAGAGSGVGGSGVQQVYTGASPPAAPDDPTEAAVFYPDSGGALQQWDVGSQAWV